MRVIVAEARKFKNKGVFDNVMTWLLPEGNDIEIVSGYYHGADTLAEEYAKTFGLKLKVFPVYRDKNGKASCPIRNNQMAKYASENGDGMLIAFWDGKSRGTKNMIDNAFAYGMDVHVIRVDKVMT